MELGLRGRAGEPVDLWHTLARVEVLGRPPGKRLTEAPRALVERMLNLGEDLSDL